MLNDKSIQVLSLLNKRKKKNEKERDTLSKYVLDIFNNIYNLIIERYTDFPSLTHNCYENGSKYNLFANFEFDENSSEPKYSIETHNLSKFNVNSSETTKYGAITPYLKSIIDEESEFEISIIVFNIMHEFGHIYDYEYFNRHNILGYYNSYDELDKNNSKLLFQNKVKNKKTYHKYIYHISKSELFADKFAYSNFVYVWKNLIKQQLI